MLCKFPFVPLMAGTIKSFSLSVILYVNGEAICTIPSTSLMAVSRAPGLVISATICVSSESRCLQWIERRRSLVSWFRTVARTRYPFERNYETVWFPMKPVPPVIKISLRAFDMLPRYAFRRMRINRRYRGVYSSTFTCDLSAFLLYIIVRIT